MMSETNYSIVYYLRLQTGELVIKGPNVMKGYKNNPEANKEVFLEGGWYRSGDVANIDETGMVYITDRLKELIKASINEENQQKLFFLFIYIDYTVYCYC